MSNLDLSFQKDTELLLKLIDLLRELKPDAVFTHWPNFVGGGGDPNIGAGYSHGNAGAFGARAYRLAMHEEVETKLPPYKIGGLIYFQGNAWTPNWFSWRPDIFIDISDTIQKKYEAYIQSTHSDIPPGSGNKPSLLREARMAWSRLAGVVSGCKWAEAFKIEQNSYCKLALDEIPKEWMTPWRGIPNMNIQGDLDDRYDTPIFPKEI